MLTLSKDEASDNVFTCVCLQKRDEQLQLIYFWSQPNSKWPLSLVNTISCVFLSLTDGELKVAVLVAEFHSHQVLHVLILLDFCMERVGFTLQGFSKNCISKQHSSRLLSRNSEHLSRARLHLSFVNASHCSIVSSQNDSTSVTFLYKTREHKPFSKVQFGLKLRRRCFTSREKNH